MTSVNSELTRFCHIEYLNTMSSSELAYWLINSFTPKRYRDKDDVVEYACRRLHQISYSPLVDELMGKLWEIHGEKPEALNVVNFEVYRANNQSKHARGM